MFLVKVILKEFYYIDDIIGGTKASAKKIKNDLSFNLRATKNYIIAIHQDY